MGTTEQLARYLVETNLKDIPAEALDRAKDAIIDFVGGAMVGCQTYVGKVTTEYVRKLDASPEAGVIGSGFRTTAPYAAFANATLDHAPELEALGGPIAYYNPAPALAACLAVTEKLDFGGREVLEGLIAGFELQGRVSHACRPNPFLQITSCFLGAAAVAAKILRLNVDQVRSALSLCASQTSGLPLTQETTKAHYLELSYPPRVGVESALLASEGISANPNIIEDPLGYGEAFIGKGKYNLDEMTRNWGNPYAITQVGIKKYPCCFGSHRAIDATMALLREHSLPYEQVEKVVANINRWIAKWVGEHHDPRNEDEARFSLEHILGTAILKGKVAPESFTDDAVLSREFKEARKKIKVVVRRDWPAGKEAAGALVEIKLKDGRTLSKKVDYPSSPTRAEIIETYKERAQRLMPLRRAECTLDMMLELEKLDSITELMDMLTMARM